MATIEATGQTGWLAFRYQYRVPADNSDYFGYAETEAEALAAIAAAGGK